MRKFNKLNDLDKKIPVITKISFWLEKQRPKNLIVLYPILKAKDLLRNFIFRHRKKRYFAQVMPSQKAIYFNIPKNGSTMLGYIFGKYIDKQKQKIDIEEILNHRDFYKFTFVRNPYSRLYSSYCHFISNPNNHSQNLFNGGIARNFQRFGKKFYPKMSFESFVNSLCSISDEILDEHVVPQYKFITDSDGNLVVDEVFKLEDIDAVFPKICKRIGIEPVKLRHDNRTKYKHREEWRKFCTPEIKEKIYKRYKEDFKRFGYEK